MPIELPDWESLAKPAFTIACLASLWTWETLEPLATDRTRRWRHAGRNVAIAVLNTVVLGLLFASATVGVAAWAAEQRFGLLHQFDLPRLWRIPAAIVLLDGWLYAWHWLNHQIPVLWRFHRMHHSDREMDVTSATRFHLGEHLASATLRLAIIPLFGVTAFEILTYDSIVVAITMLHHANISLGRFDPVLKIFVVTPGMHRVHHSRVPSETNSNYSVFLSLWDRIFRTYRQREVGEKFDLGLNEFGEDHWQSVGGMLKTPFVRPPETPSSKVAE